VRELVSEHSFIFCSALLACFIIELLMFSCTHISDVGFSSEGGQVVVASRSVDGVRGDLSSSSTSSSSSSISIRIYRISGTSSSLIRGTEQLLPMQSVSVPSLQGGMRALQWVGQYLFVVAAAAGPLTGANCSYALSVWRVSSLDDDPTPIQRIAFDLPPVIADNNNSINSLFVSSSLQNPWLDCSLCVEPTKQRYLIVSSRSATSVVDAAHHISRSCLSHHCGCVFMFMYVCVCVCIYVGEALSRCASLSIPEYRRRRPVALTSSKHPHPLSVVRTAICYCITPHSLTLRPDLVRPAAPWSGAPSTMRPASPCEHPSCPWMR
jgi:hypothetical protein